MMTNHIIHPLILNPSQKNSHMQGDCVTDKLGDSEAENTLWCVYAGVCIRICVRKVPMFVNKLPGICICVGLQNSSVLRCFTKQHVAF